MSEEMQTGLARQLWENGFGEDELRNWRVAGLLMADPGFEHWKLQAKKLMDYSGSEPGTEEAVITFLQGVAFWVYDLSQRLEHPSDDPFVNWRVAQALRYWLAGL